MRKSTITPPQAKNLVNLENGTAHWLSPNTGATNESGFTALPGGMMRHGSFNDIRSLGSWWSSTKARGEYAMNRELFYNMGTVARYTFWKPAGFSIRCIRD